MITSERNGTTDISAIVVGPNIPIKVVMQPVMFSTKQTKIKNKLFFKITCLTLTLYGSSFVQKGNIIA